MCISFDCEGDVVDHPNAGRFEIKKEYNNEQNRLDSFTGWNSNAIEPKELALVGFYFTGNDDLVKCNFCGIEVGQWAADDKAYDEHMKIFPTCPLISQKHTPNIPIDINLFKKTIQPPDYSDINVRIASFNKNWPSNKTQTPEELSEAGFYKYKCGDKVRCFTCGGGLKDWTDSDDPWEEHALSYPNCYYVILKKGEEFINTVKDKYASRFDDVPFIPSSPPPLPSRLSIMNLSSNSNIHNTTPSNTEIDLSPSKELVSKKVKTSESPTTSDSKSVSSSASSSNTTSCKICFDSTIDTILIPCMHIVVCNKCASKVNKCPACNTDIIKADRVYFS